jgi:hypothetical protein
MQPITLTLLYDALAEPIGLCIETPDPERARQKLYRLRDQANDQDLGCLSFVTSPTNPTQLWIIKVKK